MMANDQKFRRQQELCALRPPGRLLLPGGETDLAAGRSCLEINTAFS
jgi:hypothetical protein